MELEEQLAKFVENNNAEEGEFIVNDNDAVYCKLCKQAVCDGNWNLKRMKQHVKNKVHKKNQKKGSKAPTKTTHTAPKNSWTVSKSNDNTTSRNPKPKKADKRPKQQTTCELCSMLEIENIHPLFNKNWIQALEERNNAVAKKADEKVATSEDKKEEEEENETNNDKGEEEGEEEEYEYFPNVCFTPEFIKNPKKFNSSNRAVAEEPFITTVSSSVPDVPYDLDSTVGMYCMGGDGRTPNIDVEFERQDVRGWSQARKALLAAKDEHKTYWATFQIEDLEHPKWWSMERPVPTYDQLIVATSKADIGIHFDTYTREGKKPSPVHTYLTIYRGSKQVILLPPKQKLFKDGDEFPINPTADIIKKIKIAGGYYFSFEAIREKEVPNEDDELDNPEYDHELDNGDPITLFIPKGWYHWLHATSDWSIILTASAFD